MRKVDDGSALVTQSGRMLEEMVSSVRQVTTLITEIAAASEEQSTGIDQVNQAITQVDQVVQSNSAQIEELSSTAQALSRGPRSWRRSWDASASRTARSRSSGGPRRPRAGRPRCPGGGSGGGPSWRSRARRPVRGLDDEVEEF